METLEQLLRTFFCCLYGKLQTGTCPIIIKIIITQVSRNIFKVDSKGTQITHKTFNFTPGLQEQQFLCPL